MLYCSACLLMSVFWFHFIFLLWSWGVSNCTILLVANTRFLFSTRGTSCSCLLCYCSNCIFKVIRTLVATIAYCITLTYNIEQYNYWPTGKVIWVETADCSCSHKSFFHANFSIQSAPECMILFAKFPKLLSRVQPPYPLHGGRPGWPSLQPWLDPHNVGGGLAPIVTGLYLGC
jgi:hypothetical protein